MKIIAHRGYSKRFPENTLRAFEEALKRGADAVELDVHFSRDKELVVHHDYDLATRPAARDSYTKLMLRTSKTWMLARGSMLHFLVSASRFWKKFLQR